MNQKLLKNGLKELGLEDYEDEIKKLQLYISELELWNKKYGLVNASGDELIIKHIFDSLAPLSLVQKYKPESIADIGSGAGLPGIPIAIFLKDTEVFLVERSGRRVAFLNNVLALLNIDNVKVINKNLEEVDDKYDMVVFRAFRQIDEFINDLLKIKKPNGCLFAYKGKFETIKNEISLLIDKITAYKIEKVQVPFLDDERNIFVIE